MNNYLSVRWVNFLCFIAVLMLLAGASYLQHVKGLQPCPLCMVQRLAFIAMAGLFFLGIILPSISWVVKVHNGLIFIVAALGLAAALRQLWLLHFMPPLSDCGADFFYLLQHLPFNQLLTEILQGQGDCAKESWRLLGVSLPAWSAIDIAAFMLIVVWQMFRRDN